MDAETAGDPITGLEWTHRTTAKLADEPRLLGIAVGARTVARLLKTMGFALRVNHKKRAGASHPDRNAQFQHIANQLRYDHVGKAVGKLRDQIRFSDMSDGI